MNDETKFNEEAGDKDDSTKKEATDSLKNSAASPNASQMGSSFHSNISTIDQDVAAKQKGRATGSTRI